MNWLEIAPLAFSAVALSISAVTAWLTLFRRGNLKMTRPNVIFFGFDSTPGKPDPKIFMRCLLYSTAAKGQLVENLFVRLSRVESVQNFSIWVYGEKNDLTRGSGLYVGRDGVAKNHHFLIPPDNPGFSFRNGDYQLQVFANLVGKGKPLLLFETRLSMTDDQAQHLENGDHGLYFDWGPESRRYFTKLDKKPDRPNSAEAASLIDKLLPPPESIAAKPRVNS